MGNRAITEAMVGEGLAVRTVPLPRKSPTLNVELRISAMPSILTKVERGAGSAPSQLAYFSPAVNT